MTKKGELLSVYMELMAKLRTAVQKGDQWSGDLTEVGKLIVI